MNYVLTCVLMEAVPETLNAQFCADTRVRITIKATSTGGSEHDVRAQRRCKLREGDLLCIFPITGILVLSWLQHAFFHSYNARVAVLVVFTLKVFVRVLRI